MSSEQVGNVEHKRTHACLQATTRLARNAQNLAAMRAPPRSAMARQCQWWDREVSACSGPRGHDEAPPSRQGVKIRCPWSDTTHTVSKRNLTKFLAEDHWNRDADGRPEIPVFLLRGGTGVRDPWSTRGNWNRVRDSRDEEGHYCAHVQWENPGKGKGHGKNKSTGKGYQHSTCSRSRSRDDRRRRTNDETRDRIFGRQKPCRLSARREQRDRHELSLIHI